MKHLILDNMIIPPLSAVVTFLSIDIQDLADSCRVLRRPYREWGLEVANTFPHPRCTVSTLKDVCSRIEQGHLALQYWRL